MRYIEMNLRFAAFLFSLAIFGLFISVNVAAQGIGDPNRGAETGRYNIAGKIFLPDGKPAVGVRVELSGGDFMSLSTNSDNDGAFMFSGVSGGNFTVTAKPKEFPAETERLSIERAVPGQTFKIFFNLRSTVKTYSSALLIGVPEGAVAKLQSGMEKAAKNDKKGAMALYDEAIAAYPNFAAAYYQKGTLYLQMNEPDKALGSFVKAIEIKPDYLEAKYSVGYTQYVKKNYEIAAAVFDDVINQKVEMPEAHMYRGISLFHLGFIDEAEKQLKLAEASKAGERIALAHRFLGGIYMQKKQNATAAEELQKYLDLVPKAPDADKIKTTISDLKKAK